MDPLDRTSRRTASRARRRRNRRIVAAVLLVAIGGGTVAALTQPWSGGASSSPPAREPAAQTGTTPVARTDTAPAPPETTDGMPSAAEQAAAVKRVADLGLPIYRAGGKGRWLALTFDDGPGAYTETAMKALRDNDARATFFLNGKNLAEWGHLAKAETELAAVGNHTWSHPFLPGLPHAEMVDEIARSHRAIAKASGEPVTLMRPPYGAHNAAVDAEVKRLGAVQVLWSVDSMDSQGADWKEILRLSKEGAKPGAIILLHENRGQTLKAVNRLLPWLKKRGLQPVTVPELLALDPPSVAQIRRDAKGFAG